MFASVQSAGTVIIFVSLGVLFVLVASYTAALAARIYLLIAQDTAAGLDEIKWSNEPMFDWLPQALYMLVMLAVWVVPAGFLARGLGEVFLPENAALRSTILVAATVWLLFPAGFLAVQKADAIIGLLRHCLALLGFYVLTGVLLALLAGLVYFGLFTTLWLVAILAAVLGAAGLMIHARLLGRIGWLLARDDRQAVLEPKKGRKKKKKARAEVTDPWEEPEIPEQEVEAALPMLAVVEVEEPAPQRPAYEEPPPDPYEMADEPLPAQENPPQVELRKGEIEEEVKLRTHEVPAGPGPALALFSGVWSFPFYPESFGMLAPLSLWGLGVLVLARILVLLWPFSS